MFDKRNIRIYYLRTLERIRSFLLSRNSREFLIFLFFVFVSFCFWLLQVLNDDYETEFSIPLRLKNVPNNVVLTSEPPGELRIGVKDRGTVLVNYMLGQTFYPVTIDFKEYADKGTSSQIRVPMSVLTKKIAGQLSQSTKLLTIKPDTVEFIYTTGQAKKVPVKLQGKVGLDRQYYISDIIYAPDSVMVYAPKEILDTITAAYTEPVNFENISDTTHRRISLANVKGARFTPSFNDVTLMVDVYSEKTVEVPVRGVNFPPDKVLRTFPSKVQVTFQVGLSHFKSITADDFFISVTYEELLHNKGEKCPVNLKSVPRYVNHVRLNPKEVDYLIEQQIKFND
ncbi:CdaR family protein [Phocaeicola sp.]